MTARWWLLTLGCVVVGVSLGSREPRAASGGDAGSKKGEDKPGSALEERLREVAEGHKLRIVAALPDGAVELPVRQDGEKAEAALAALAKAANLRRVDKKGVVVLGPAVYPPVDDHELLYWQATQELTAFLQNLDPKGQEVLHAGEWFNLKTLPAEQQRRLRLGLLRTDRDPVWETWLKTHEAAVGFIFDPYVEIEGGLEGLGYPRKFFRASAVVRAHRRLIPGKIAGGVRGVLP